MPHRKQRLDLSSIENERGVYKWRLLMIPPWFLSSGARVNDFANGTRSTTLFPCPRVLPLPTRNHAHDHLNDGLETPVVNPTNCDVCFSAVCVSTLHDSERSLCSGIQQDRTASDGRYQGLAVQGGRWRGLPRAGREGGQHLQPGACHCACRCSVVVVAGAHSSVVVVASAATIFPPTAVLRMSASALRSGLVLFETGAIVQLRV